ncbi:hypothetical protein [Yoonia sp.]|uniref:hypothetical protein n=1 Tax=Yoonia sp. TaxID=2212373 RepID=UPI003F4AC5A0
MGHDWIIDVLADVRRFARQNDMPLLSAHLDDALRVAAAEMRHRDRPSTDWSGDQAPSQDPYRAD